MLIVITMIRDKDVTDNLGYRNGSCLIMQIVIMHKKMIRGSSKMRHPWWKTKRKKLERSSIERSARDIFFS